MTTIGSGTTSSGLTIGGDGDTLLVFAGGAAIDTTVVAGGNIVVSGGRTSDTLVSSGGFEAIYAGGVTNGTHLVDSGMQTVGSGGTAIGTVVSGGNLLAFGAAIGNLQLVGAGGLASATVLSDGGQQFMEGGTAISAVIEGGGLQFVESASVASGTIVGSGGEQYVEIGGSTDATEIQSGGFVDLDKAGSVSDMTIDGGGLALVENPSTLVGTVLRSGATLLIPSSATVTGTVNEGGAVVSSGVAVLSGTDLVSSFSGGVPGLTISGTQAYVLEHGVTLGATVLDGAIKLCSGGTASDTIIGNGGYVDIDANAAASGTTIGSGGTEIVYFGPADGTTIDNGGIERLEAGYTSDTIVSSGGVFQIEGGTADATELEPGGIINLVQSSYDSSGSVYLYGSNTLFIEENGSYSDFQLAGDYTDDDIFGLARDPDGSSTDIVLSAGSGGPAILPKDYTVSSGQILSGLQVLSGDVLTVNFGGTIIDTTIDSGGYVDLEGYADNTLVRDGGDLVPFDGTSAFVNDNGTHVESGGELDEYGYSSDAVISSGGIAIIEQFQLGFSNPPPTMFGVDVASGGYLVDNGDDLVGGTIEAGAHEITHTGSLIFRLGTGVSYAGPDASGLVVGSGASGFVYTGESTSWTVEAGGYLEVDGPAMSWTVEAGGYLEVDGPAMGTLATGLGSTAGTRVAGEALIYGSATSTSVLSGGDLSIIGSSTDTVVDAGGREYVQGLATGTIVSSGGLQLVVGGEADGTQILNGGAEVLRGGGSTASASVIDAGGYLVVTPGAVTSNTDIEPGGLLITSGVMVVDNHGSNTYEGLVASNLQADGPLSEVYVLPEGQVQGGGAGFFIADYGSTIDIVLSSGATELVYSGGVATDTTILSGANLDVVGGGTVIGGSLGAGVTLEISTTSASGTFEFAGAGGTLQVDDASVFADTVAASGLVGGAETDAPSASAPVIGGFDDTDSIVLGGLQLTGTAQLDADDVLHFANSGTAYAIQFEGDYAADFFHLTPDADGYSTDITVDGTPCYCRGTLILTEGGERPVEDLRIGDRLVTLSGEARPIRWIGRRSYSGRFAASNPDVLPVLIRPGALADDVPRRDLVVSPLHALFLDGCLVPASALVNGVSIVQLDEVEQVDYFHLELDTHDVLFAEGTPAESFVDDDSRGMFHNAAEYRALHPDIGLRPALYCAPRLDGGEALEAMRRRLARRADPAPTPAASRIEGVLDEVRRDRIAGWARDAAVPDRRVRLRILDGDVILGLVTAEIDRPDLGLAGIGDGRHGFELIVPGGLAAGARHRIRALHLPDDQELAHSPWDVPPNSLAAADDEPALQGFVDSATRHRIVGWAAMESGEPVALRILDNGVPIAGVVANRYRADLHRLGLGGGWHGFEVVMQGGLDPLSDHLVRICRESDGAELSGSPVRIARADRFDQALEQVVAEAVDALDAAPDRHRVHSFMLAQAERVLQQQADARPGRQGHPAARHALVIDDRVPVPSRDAGSRALLSHMQALSELGYAVSFVAAAEMGAAASSLAPLTDAGIGCCTAPAYPSVEEVLRRQAGTFDVVYLHRVSVASRYMALVRHYMSRARILYSVADLHHVRLERQAAAEDRPELRALSRRVRLQEYAAAWSADAVLTHSAEEAAVLRAAVPEATVHRVPWGVPVRRQRRGWIHRHGIAFIGSYAHPPNLDAARWLVEAIMPLVHRDDPTIECLLAGSEPPESLRRLARPGVTILGHVGDLHDDVFGRVRLTVAPLRFGAGVKGKVLDSLAAGIPCVMTPIAAEGLRLPPKLHDLVAQEPADIASLIIRLHGDPRGNRSASRAGLDMVASAHGQPIATEALRAALEGRAPFLDRATAG